MKFRKTGGAQKGDASKRDRRLSIFLWAMLISFICGAIEFGQPLEDLIQGGRDLIRSRPSQTRAVVLAVDDRTVASLGGLSYGRQHDAKALDTLFALGANRVFYDRAYADPVTPEGDAAFEAAIARHKGRVFLGTMRSWDMTLKTYTTIEPLPGFARNAQMTSLNGKISPFSLSARFPYSARVGDRDVPSLSSMLSGRRVASEDNYKPDFSIQANTIPTVSFLDVVQQRVSRSSIEGRDIVIGPTSVISQDYHRIVNQGWMPGVYFHVIGAETLQRGTPQYWGWFPPFIIATILALCNLYARRKTIVRITIAAAAVILVAFPIYLDEQLITVDIVPAVLLFSIIAYRSNTLRRVKNSAETNLISGLPNLAALHQAGERVPQTLIALKMKNFAEIAASFDKSVESAVISEIHRRVVLSGVEGEMYHGEDTLLWFSPLPMDEELAHHLEGLKAILSTALPLEGREIDLSVAFGVDADQERPIASRIGSATLCAEEAAASNDIWKFYDPQRRHEAAWQLSLLSRLDLAIDKGEVWVAYQPQLDIAEDRIAGAEALVRWTHPERGLIGPDEFIAVAEKHNRIEKLTNFVLDEAAAAASEINAQGIDFTIAVNLPVQLLQVPHLMDIVEDVLFRHALPAHKLVLEITETGKLDRNGPSMAMMKDLTDRGVRIAIDDYGTGNATLDYLKILPADEVKIDRQFVANMEADDKDRILVRSTIEMVHSLGRKVIAEGVETKAELETLSGFGCDIAQGYLIGKPVPFATLAARLLDQETRKTVNH